MVKPKKSKVGPPPEGCPLEEVLTFLAGAWTPKILWYLRAEPRRFGDLRRDLGRVSAKVLTTRLRELEARGIVTRTVMPTSPPTVEYALTDFGGRFLPVLKTIAEVGVELRERQRQRDGGIASSVTGTQCVAQLQALAEAGKPANFSAS